MWLIKSMLFSNFSPQLPHKQENNGLTTGSGRNVELGGVVTGGATGGGGGTGWIGGWGSARGTSWGLPAAVICAANRACSCCKVIVRWLPPGPDMMDKVGGDCWAAVETATVRGGVGRTGGGGGGSTVTS